MLILSFSVGLILGIFVASVWNRNPVDVWEKYFEGITEYNGLPIDACIDECLDLGNLSLDQISAINRVRDKENKR